VQQSCISDAMAIGRLERFSDLQQPVPRLIVRRPEVAGWFSSDSLPAGPIGPASALLRRTPHGGDAAVARRIGGEEHTMSVAELLDDVDEGAEGFALDVRIVTDVPAGDASRGCTTNDGCDPTCASSCVSGGL
jgi:FxLD family lantipeptide